MPVIFTIEIEQETDRRWLAEVVQLPGSAFHDSDEIGPRMLARLAKHSGLRPEDL